MSKKITAADLRQFTGTSEWFRHSLMRNILYTEGVQFVAESASAYWLIDKIATLQLEPKIAAEEFQVWRLVVTGTEAVLTADDGNGIAGKTLHTERLTFTDFPLAEIEMWVEGNVILLPSEH
jgi:hypothetical protein